MCVFVCFFSLPFHSSSIPLLSGAPYCFYRLLRENLFTLTMERMCVHISNGYYNSARVLFSDGRLSTRLCRNISTFTNERQSVHSVRSYVSSFQFTFVFFLVEYLSPRQLIAIFFRFVVSCLHKRLHKFKTNFFIGADHWAFAHFSYATLTYYGL